MPVATVSSTLSPDHERDLLQALFTTCATLPDLARAFNLTLIDLLDLIATPDFQSRLIALEQAAAHATRIAASRHLHAVINTISESLHAHLHNLTLLEPRTDQPALEQRRHEHAQARRQAATVLRLTRFSPLAPGTILRRFTSTATTREPSAPLSQSSVPHATDLNGSSVQGVSAPARTAALLPSTRSSGVGVSPATTPSTSPSCPQPKGPIVNSRGQSQSATAAPRTRPLTHQHPESVLVPPVASRSLFPPRSRAAALLQRAGSPLARAP